MGHNISSINGVKSDNFYEQGNGINEIWVDDLEVISRLPFGDSDLGQAGWPAGNWPKIPWHQFIIPLKRDVTPTSNINSANSANDTFTMTESITCYPCLKTYPEVGYFGMYKNWNPFIAALFGNVAIAFGIVILGSLLFLLQWNEVVMDLHRFMPDNVAFGEAVTEPPIRAGSWHSMKPWLWRRCLSRLLMLVAGTVLVMCGIPGAMLAMKDRSGPEVFFETWKGMAIMIWTNVGFQFLINIVLLYHHCWRYPRREDEDSLRKREQNPGSKSLRIEASVDPGLTVIQIMKIEEPQAEEA
ncbi:hypothetical protein N7451_003341 [Penicillium sp. IBT 35674x]|nr:hypothetical protein N7451_003341 [Penicillium sp. IBT 35674x]